MLEFFLAALETEEDKERLRTIYSEYEPKMRRMAISMLKSSQKADEVIQESFVKIIRAYDKCREKEGRELEGWLIIIVKNVVYDMWRKEGIYNEWHHSLDIYGIEEDDDFDEQDLAGFINAREQGSDALWEDTKYQLLVQAILSLPDTYSEVLEKSLVLGWSNTKIAHSMNITENTVYIRLHRGRKKLIELLQKEGLVND